MSRRRTKLWSHTVGAYGHKVTVRELKPDGNLYLTWWDPFAGDTRRESLGHKDRELGITAARKKAAGKLTENREVGTGIISIASLLRLYESRHAHAWSRATRYANALRTDLWIAFLGPGFPARDITHRHLTAYREARMAGQIQVDGRREFGPVGDGSIQGETIYLKSVLKWATGPVSRDSKPLLLRNPVQTYSPPAPQARMRPVASYERFLAVRKHGEGLGPGGRFPYLLTLIEGLGWRISATCQLRVMDFDRGMTKTHPFGRLYRNPETDKRGYEGWVPVNADVRKALLELVAMAEGIGQYPLFPRPKKIDAATGMPVAWDAGFATKLLRKAEAAAFEAGAISVKHLPHGGFHAYRRKWATERKHLPDKDVMEAGGWKSHEALKTAYQHADPETTLRVVLDATKLREAK